MSQFGRNATRWVIGPAPVRIVTPVTFPTPGLTPGQRVVVLSNPGAAVVYYASEQTIGSLGSAVRLGPGDRHELRTDGDVYARSVAFGGAVLEVSL